MSLSRKDFLKTSIAASTALSAGPLLAAARQARGPRFRVALIGSGWWGRNIARVALQSGDCTLIALCDPDERQMAAAWDDDLGKLTSDAPPRRYKDFRDLLAAREKPDIVIVATPDHWHALPMIAAVKAGAHVYVEKPVSHTIGEGQAMVKAARETGRVVQVGLHRRVSPHNVSANAFLRSGKLGKIGMVRAFVHYGGGPGQKTPNADPPPGLDWNLWCGPAPLVPYSPAIHPKGFRLFLPFANGQLGDWGVHWMDQVLWWTDEIAPKTVFSTGGRFIKQDSSDAPDTQTATFAFDTFTLEWEHRLYAANEAEKHNVGCYFYGTEGTLHLGWTDGWTFYPANKGRPIVHEDARLNEPDGQNIRELWADFVASIRSGGARRPVADILVGHRATTLSLLGMLSLKAGRSVRWDASRETIVGDADAARLLRRAYRAPWKYPE